MRLFYVLSIAVLVGLTSCSNGIAGAKDVKLATKVDSVSYYIGMSEGGSWTERFAKVPGDPINMDAFFNGFCAAFLNSNMKLPKDSAQAFIQAYFQKIQGMEAEKAAAEAKVKGEEAQKKGEAYLVANAKKAGVKVTASGLQYEIIKAGSGPKPKATDKVKVHYVGTTVDGVEFDSSVKRGQPVTFPVEGVIPGWTEALQLMPLGSKWKLTIPANLAYGEKGAGAQIAPNSVLVFEVELLAINPKEDEASK